MEDHDDHWGRDPNLPPGYWVGPACMVIGIVLSALFVWYPVVTGSFLLILVILALARSLYEQMRGDF